MIRTRFFSLTLLLFVLFYSPFSKPPKTSEKNKGWVQSLRKKIEEIDSLYPGQMGVYIKDLETGDDFSFRGEDTWYVASGVKLPIAIEILRQIDEKKFTLDSQIELTENDFIDGAGETNLQKPGSRLTIRFLLEQMLIHSDNTASDLLIQKASLASVNGLIQRLVSKGFSPITTLADVRRHVYSLFHPSAFALKGRDFLFLKSARRERERVKRLRTLLKLKKAELKSASLDQAFLNYYSQKLNSATLQSYSRILEEVVRGNSLQASSRDFLLQTMLKVQTGQNRIQAGLPQGYTFAHKTGTQHLRVCDFGIAQSSKNSQQKVLISACSREFRNVREAEAALKKVGEAVSQAGVFRNDGVIANH